MTNKKAFLLFLNDNEIKVIDSLEEISNMTFDDPEMIKNIKIFEIEFQKKISFKTKINPIV